MNIMEKDVQEQCETELTPLVDEKQSRPHIAAMCDYFSLVHY